ncbi:MAG TPA: HAD family phosphatase [Gaiellaceae bacterium]|jgi:HAD superfamily hydrolase (TIGR01509 family)|nr:HAD family phosphatase [Gaiellaceae bacterium]
MRDPRLVAALLFDFNGTLSDDEGVQCAIFRELFAEQGRPLSEREYFDGLAGRSDPEIVERWLGTNHPAAAEVLERRVQLFRERVGDGSTVPPHVREAVLRAERARLAIVSGAARSEVETVLRAASLDVFDVIVSAEDVTRGKPDPEGYLLALEQLGVQAADAVAIEDAPPGVAAAKAAGLRCVAVLGTASRERLGEADEIAPRLDARLVERLLAR